MKFIINLSQRFESNGHFTAGYSIGFDINPNGSILCSGSSNGCIYLYNFHTSKLIKRLDGSCNKYASSQPCMDVKFQPNSNEKLLAASFWNGTIKIFEFQKFYSTKNKRCNIIFKYGNQIQTSESQYIVKKIHRLYCLFLK